VKVLNIRFRKTKKVYPFIVQDEGKYSKGDYVIVDSWDKCKIIISKKNSRYKKFNTLELANEWIKNGCTYEKKVY
jgi:hypothetical protein